MTQVTTLAAEAREHAGKGKVRAVRRLGRVPGVIYGDKQPPVTISIEDKILCASWSARAFLTQLFDVEIAGKKHRVLPRDVQFDPVSDRPLHVDFLRVSAGTTVRVGVPVVFLNSDKSPGIKRGGTLNVVHHTIEVQCAPDKIPAKFEVSLEGLQINDTIHLSPLKLPEGVKLTTHGKGFYRRYNRGALGRPFRERTGAAAATAAATPAAEGEAAAAAPGAAAPAAAAGTPAAAGAKGAAAPAAAGAPAAKKPEGKK